MRALLYIPYEEPEIIDTDDFESTLGRDIDYIWPARIESVCIIARADMDELTPNRVLNEGKRYRGKLLSGPFICVGVEEEEFTDITDDQIDRIKEELDYAPEEWT